MNHIPAPAIDSSCFKTYCDAWDGKYYPPSPFEDLRRGINWVTHVIQNGTIGTIERPAMIRWLSEANQLLEVHFGVPPSTLTELYVAVSKPSALPPQICTVCNFKNDYAGPEHLQANGTYICRGCK